MLRFDDCLCGTTTTGTGTLSLAQIPSGAGGGIDPDVWARATGIGFGNSAAFLIDYTIVEYTDATFATEKQKEAGSGTLTLGSSSGIANATLARTTIDWTVTSLNSQPASVSVKPGSGISVGTAANVLIFCAPRVESVPAYPPYYSTVSSDSNWGVSPDGPVVQTGTGSLWNLTGSRDYYQPFRVSCPMLVKRCSFRISTYSSPTGTPVVYIRIYDISLGKLLYDFTPSSGVTITATGAYSTGAAGNGFLLTPGDYFIDFCATGQTGGTATAFTGSVAIYEDTNPALGRLGAESGAAIQGLFAGGGTAGAGPDPANTSGIAGLTGGAPGIVFGLSPS